MQYTHEESHIPKDDYFEVFDKNKKVKYGITSLKEKQKIEIKLPRLVEAVDFLELFWKSTSLIDNGL